MTSSLLRSPRPLPGVASCGWLVQIGRRPYSFGNKALLVPYDPEITELFFIVDGDLNIYLIPSRVVAGRVQILLRTYSSSAALGARP
jgi:hypothetical protein